MVYNIESIAYCKECRDNIIGFAEELRANLGIQRRNFTHKDLLERFLKHQKDYAPWGNVERWKDSNWSYPDCSCGCKWFLELEGSLGMDWGVCLNKKSHRCGLLTFEHQAGLDCFEED